MAQTTTDASARRIGRLYAATVGYDAVAEGVDPREAVQILREFREAAREGEATA